jgi:type II secretory pathway pseudopilin PulG
MRNILVYFINDPIFQDKQRYKLYQMKKLIKKLNKDQAGTNLIEILIAMLLFSIVIMAATGIMQSVVEGQKSALASQNTQESMRFTFEMMAKEIRNARSEHLGSGCVGHPSFYKVYNTQNPAPEGTRLYFRNKNDECVIYYLSGDQLFIDRDGTFLPVTPNNVKITKLYFYVHDDLKDAFHSIQPRVTISMEAEMNTVHEKHKQEIVLQTTVSSRYYE